MIRKVFERVGIALIVLVFWPIIIGVKMLSSSLDLYTELGNIFRGQYDD